MCGDSYGRVRVGNGIIVRVSYCSVQCIIRVRAHARAYGKQVMYRNKCVVISIIPLSTSKRIQMCTHLSSPVRRYLLPDSYINTCTSLPSSALMERYNII